MSKDLVLKDVFFSDGSNGIYQLVRTPFHAVHIVYDKKGELVSLETNKIR